MESFSEFCFVKISLLLPLLIMTMAVIVVTVMSCFLRNFSIFPSIKSQSWLPTTNLLSPLKSRSA